MKKEFRINIVGLSMKVHEFDFRIDQSFLKDFNSQLAEDMDLDVKILLDKHETFLNAEFLIKGHITLTCDRSLEPFKENISIKERIVFKYADKTEEISEDIIHIARETVTLDMSQYVYDLIGTSLPMKKLHPCFRNDEEHEDGSIVYTSESTTDVSIDPRWEKLKNLK